MKRKLLIAAIVAMCAVLCIMLASCGGADSDADGEPTAGLEYALSNDGTYYVMTSGKNCTDAIIRIPSTYNGLPVKEIGDNAFSECNTVEKIFIPEGVTRIGNGAFSSSSAVKISVPNSIESIGESAFAYSGKMDTTEEDGLTYIGNDENPYVVLVTAKVGVDIGTKCKVKEGTRVINDKVFMDHTNYAEIELPNTVVSIGNLAFEGCTGLKSIKIPESIRDISANAFEDCSALQYNEYENALYLGTDANPYVVLIKVAESGKADECVINEKTKLIHKRAFEMSGAREITIPDSVVIIDEEAFSMCNALTKVVIGNGVTDIKKDAFNGCRLLYDLTLSENLVNIGEQAFCGCGLIGVEIPSKVVSIGIRAFDRCSKLSILKLPDGIKAIGDYAFCECAIKKVDIPSGIVRLSESAFDLAEDMEYYEDENAYYLGNEQDPYMFLAKVKDGVESFEFNNSTRFMSAGAFGNLINTLKSVTFGAECKITEIPSGAFNYMNALEKVVISGAVTTIREGAFNYCNALSDVTISKNVTVIERYAITQLIINEDLHLNIKCEAQSQPAGWESDWCDYFANVQWGVQ